MNDRSKARRNRLLGALSYRSQYAIAVAVAVTGIAASIVLLSVLRQQDRDSIRKDFERFSLDRVSAVKRTLSIDFLALQFLKSFYDGSNVIERHEFTSYVAPLIKGRSSIQAIQWAPRVPAAECAKYEKMAALDSLPDFRITEFDRQGKPERVSPRDEYFPIYYVEPSGSNTRELGFDLASLPACRDAMNRARDTGASAATPAILLPHTAQDRIGVRVFLAVYFRNAPVATVEQRRKNLQGFAAGVFRLGGLVEESFADLQPAGVDVQLVDVSDPAGQRVLYVHCSRLRPSHSFSSEKIDPFRQAEFRMTKPLNVAGRHWEIHCAAAPGFVAARTSWIPWDGPAICLLLTTLLVAYLYRIAASNAKMARLAAQLVETNRQLETEATDRKRAEATLQVSQTRYRALYDMSSDAIMLLTPEEGFFSGNPATIALFGCDDEADFTSRTPTDLSPEYQPDGALSSVKAQRMTAIAMHKGSHFFEWQHRRKDGAEFPATVLLTVMELDGRRILQATVRDISEQKRMEKAAAQERAKLRAMISGMEEGVIFADSNNVVIEVNDYLCRFVGRAREEILGKRIEEFHHGEILGIILSRIGRFQNEIGSGPFVLQRAFGKAEVIMRMQPVYRDGHYDGVLLNVIDVTDLVEARRQAEIANKAKSQFLATMSHEIRTPMTSILGYTDLLADPTLSAANRDAYLATVRRNGEHLLGLINNILDLSKIEAGKLSFDIAPCNLPELLADVEATVRPRAEQRGVSFTVEFDGELPETILTDNLRVRQAIVNLAGNAVKFTQQGGVRIVAAFLPQGCDGQPAVRIQVIDTGIGIQTEVLPQLFQPFQQADTSVARRFGGTGLGLAISHHLANLLGGDLTATSVWGRGSTFTLTIPAGSIEGVAMLRAPAPTTQQFVQQPPEPADQVLEGFRVLLAEDGYDNRELIETILHKAGAVVETAENGSEAVDKAECESFDLILMDMNMPEMDGYEATRLLRSRGYQKPIVALTANAMSGDSDQCLEAGCDEYLSKPIDRARLIRTIAALVDKQLVGDQTRSMTNIITATTAPPPDAPANTSRPAIISQYLNDPDMAEILDGFVHRLAGQVDAMRQMHMTGRQEELQRMAHKLKGAGGSYGYPSLTHACALLEDAAKKRDAAAAGTALDDLTTLVQAIQHGYTKCTATTTTV